LEVKLVISLGYLIVCVYLFTYRLVRSDMFEKVCFEEDHQGQLH